MMTQRKTDVPCPMDIDGFYLGAIYTNGQWRYFYDYRQKWAFDLRSVHFQNIPSERSDHLLYTKAEFNDYLSSLDTELTAQDLYLCEGKLPLSIVIREDIGLFIDGAYEDEGFDLAQYIPDEWTVITNNPIYFVPYEIRLLWMTKHIYPSIDKVGIHRYTDVGAVKWKGHWRYFFEMFDAWKLNYGAFMVDCGLANEFKDAIFSYYRNHLPYVDENNGDEFLRLLSNFSLSIEEVSKLIYCPTAEQFSVDGLTQLNRPHLRYIINFDEQLYVRNNFSEPHATLDAISVHMPVHWSCYQANTLTYLPEHLQNLWK
ncbi:MAG: hypothetical protein RLP44_10815 [Aggregatilineales bacterium]